MSLSIPGSGEAPFSISSSPTRKGIIEFAIRKVGKFTEKLFTLKDGDLLLIEGQLEDLEVLRGLQELEIETRVASNLGALDSERLTLTDATLDPRSSLAGKTVGELNFRERYGIELAGIWREGETVGTELAEERLQIGDALLLLGPRDRLQLLDNDPDFLVLTPLGQEPPDTRRAPLAAFIMLAVVAAVMAGYAPIAIAAVVGSSIMVLSGCLNMEQAYRAIDWRAIFLIAGMLPLGTAMQETGAAAYLATQVMNLLGDSGPWTVIMGLYVLTAFATVRLFSPISMKTVLITTSRPFWVAAPPRNSWPTSTVATSPTRIGTPSCSFTTIWASCSGRSA